jgi:hypothetical protein
MLRASCLTFLVAIVVSMVALPLHAEPSSETSFQSELKSILARGLESKRGIVFHVDGEAIAGVVKRILVDAVVVANQEHATILIRLDQIDAVALD